MRRILLLITFFTLGLFARSSGQTKWQNGYYYDLADTKIAGMIINYGDHIRFKKTKKDEEQKIPVSAFKSYVVLQDSFIVSHHTKLSLSPILQVVIDNPVKLYALLPSRREANKMVLGAAGGAIGGAIAGASMKKYGFGYYFGNNADEVEKLTNENFIEIMSRIMSDMPEVVERIQDKTVKLRNLDEWIIFYKSEKARPVIPINQ